MKPTVQLHEHVARTGPAKAPVTAVGDAEHHRQFRTALRHAQRGAFEEARSTAHGIQHGPLRQRALRFVLVELAKAGLAAEAEAVLALMTDRAARTLAEHELRAIRPPTKQ